ncbi:MAG TPA: glycosyltransferase family 39 protein [Blastocatellia bacterium]|nr:glycosyltransferase family 39 protein [Blastocatellia bacterium]
MPVGRARSLFSVGVIVLLAAILRVIFFHGLAGMFPLDQADYSRLAWQITEGQWRYNEVFELSTRWGLLFPTALSYRLFGINQISSALYPMLLSLGAVVVAYLTGRHLKGERAGLLAALMIAFFPLETALASQLMNDGPLSFWLLLSLYLFLRGDDSRDSVTRRKFLLGCGLALGMAYACKFVALLILPFFLLLTLIRRRIDWQWLWIAAGLLVIFSFDFAVFKYVSGDGLRRLHLLAEDRSNSPAGLAAGTDRSPTALTVYLRWMFLEVHHTGLAFIALAVIMFRQVVRRGAARAERPWPDGLLLLWSGTLWFVLSFYPLSLRPYIPLYKLANYMLMFTAPLLVALGIRLSGCSRLFQAGCVGLILLSSLAGLVLTSAAQRVYVANTFRLHSFHESRHDRPLYCGMEDRAMLRYLDGYRSDASYIAYISPGITLRPVPDRVDFRRGYVALNRTFYFPERGYKYPPEITNPPAQWKVVVDEPENKCWLREKGMTLVEALRKRGLISPALSDKVVARLNRAFPSDRLTIYAIE